ncbi:guanine nucleotide-releasing factor 2-like isoform X3 [Lineus longissimus]|uniref:guanine nucleotide-releasing factor 2-like isoform X3 n=1 Tax=Lineus longissimus TaxID=88925 RepID=UPI00315D0468
MIGLSRSQSLATSADGGSPRRWGSGRFALRRALTVQDSPQETSKSPGSKVIQKAHSIRDKFFRRPSSSGMTPNKLIEIKSPKAKKVSRGSSFSEGTSVNEKKKKDQEVDRLKQDSMKVFNALKYTQDVVDKNILQQLPGSATIVLETIMDITTRLLNSYFSQESSVMISTFNQVYQSLANLIRWSDKVMMTADNQPVNKETATCIINAVSDGINELMKLSIDKLERQGSGNYKNRNIRNVNSVAAADKDRTSLPDIPLTPREKEILQQTQLPHFSFDVKQTDGQLNNNDNTDTPPPPKPPLPKDYVAVLRKSSATYPPANSDQPPPLPEKRKSAASLESPTSPSLKDEVFAMFNKLSNECHASMPSSSPMGSTPLSVSPSSSVGSAGINKSREDLIADSSYRDTKSPSHTIDRPIDRQYSDYDNEPFQCDSYSPSQQYDRQVSDYENNVCDSSSGSVDEINQLTQQIQGLTTNIDNRTSQHAPPIPDKKTSLVYNANSDYDNIVNANPQDILSKMRENMGQSMSERLGKFGSSPGFPFQDMSFQGFQGSSMLSSNTAMMPSLQMSNPPAGDAVDLSSQMQLSTLKPMQTSSQMSSSSLHNFSVQKQLQHSSMLASRQVVQKKVVSSQTFHSSHQSSSQASFQSSSQQSFSQSSQRVTKSSYSSTKSASHIGENGNLLAGKETIKQETKAFGEASSTAVLPSGENITHSRSLAHDAKTYEEKEIDCTGDSPPRLRHKFAHQSKTLGINEMMTAEGTQREIITGGEVFAAVSDGESNGQAPPLPPKKKAIEAYMQTFAGYSQPNFLEFSRHSMLSNRFYQEQWHQKQVEFFTPFQRSNTISVSQLGRHSHEPILAREARNADELLLAPAIPPKRNRSFSSLTTSLSDQNLALFTPCQDQLKSQTESMCHHSPTKPQPLMAITMGRELPIKTNSLPETMVSDKPDVEQKRLSAPVGEEPVKEMPASTMESIVLTEDDVENEGLVHAMDVTEHIIKHEGDTHEIRGGPIDALIVHATSVGKNDWNDEVSNMLDHHFMYQEAFLTTYRTMISPGDLIKKLISRYNKFCYCSDDKKKRLSRNTFALVIRIVDELCNDISDTIIQDLSELVFQLLCDGELMLARALRKTLLEKCLIKQALDEANQQITYLPSIQVSTRQMTLLDFKSHDIAAQMTMLDAELFATIEIPEMLLWAREQKEDMSPNLTKFTEHFNKMSYWVRSRILEKNENKEREKYLVKFIKIMKELRKLKNFNSYLALLSAVDSAPIRRLEWHKQIMDTLKEMSELINSSSSFKVYRQVLAETEPPCIPYIGLILQDLTFIHIGNQDLLPDGSVNFTKRWQQFNILEAFRRFKKAHYKHPKNKNIVTFFNDFDDHLSEESLWQISESIKPRGGKKS